MQHISPRHAALIITATILVSFASASPVLAHSGHGSGLTAGLSHPLVGLDHVIAMVAVGVLAAVLRRPLAVPAAFLTSMVVGGALGMSGVVMPGVEFAVAASVVALGAALVVAGRTSSSGAVLALVAVAGTVHGHAHGIEAPATPGPVPYVLGFVVMTALIHAAGVGIGVGLRHRSAARSAAGVLAMGAGLGLLVGLV